MADNLDNLEDGITVWQKPVYGQKEPRYRHSAETRAKISEAGRIRFHKTAERLKISVANKQRYADPQLRNLSRLLAIKRWANQDERLRASDIAKKRPGCYWKLTDKEVDAIRVRRAQGESCKSLAMCFGVTDVCISYIVNGKRRKKAAVIKADYGR